MVRVSRAALLFQVMILAFGISCTIIEDSDLQSAEEVSKLGLKSFEIVLQAQEREPKIVKIATSLNATGQIQLITWPAFNDDKIGFRSSTITGPVTSFVTYNNLGKVSTFDIKSGNTSLERYNFEYNLEGNLSKLISEGTFANGVISTVDIIEYSSGRPIKIERTANTIAGSQSPIKYNIQYNSNDGSVFSFGTNTNDPDRNEFIQNGNGGDCPNNSDHRFCNGYKSTDSGKPNLSVTIKHSYSGTKLGTLVIGESYNPGGKIPDRYAFHPLMLFRSEINQSEALLIFYMIDWWTVKVNNSTGGNVKGDLVLINFTYGL